MGYYKPFYAVLFTQVHMANKFLSIFAHDNQPVKMLFIAIAFYTNRNIRFVRSIELQIYFHILSTFFCSDLQNSHSQTHISKSNLLVLITLLCSLKQKIFLETEKKADNCIRFNWQVCVRKKHTGEIHLRWSWSNCNQSCVLIATAHCLSSKFIVCCILYVRQIFFLFFWSHSIEHCQPARPVQTTQNPRPLVSKVSTVFRVPHLSQFQQSYGKRKSHIYIVYIHIQTSNQVRV